MEDFVYRRDLLNAKEMLQLSERSNHQGILQLVVHLLAIVGGAMFVWASYGTWWVILAWLVYGIFLAFVFAPLHECIHGTAFRSRFLNNVCASFAGFLLFLPANYFRLFHFAHHRYTNDPNLDPELKTSKPDTIWKYLWAMTGIGSYWWPQLRTIALHSCGKVNESFIPKSRIPKIVRESRFHAIAYISIAIVSILTQNTWVLIFWIIPALMGMVGLRLFLLAEHTGCEISSNMFRNTRTTLTNLVLNRLAWNMPYHSEHHLFPSVPFHRLPALHVHVKHRIQTISPGYSKFHKEFVQSL